MGLRYLALTCFTVTLLATVALAQSANYTSLDATPDKPLQLSYHASAHKNCTPAQVASVAGMLTCARPLDNG